MLLNKKYTKLNKIYWQKVEPIKWIVIEKYYICISRNILCANEQFNYKDNIKSNLSESNFKWFLNTYLKKIQPIKNNQKDLDNDSKLNDNTKFRTKII